jgi:hypothetical protein
MTKTFVIRAKTKVKSGPSGMGAKFVHGEMTIVPTREAIHCADLGFNSIKAVFIEQLTIGSFVTVNLVGPGSLDNFASLRSYNLNGTGGYPVIRTEGTLKANFLAFGE